MGLRLAALRAAGAPLLNLHFKQGKQIIEMAAHSEILLSKCAQFRDQSQFINVRLKVCEDIFAAHRIVLAANDSDYFHAIFTDGMKESNQKIIELKDESTSPDALKIVMDSISTGDLNVNGKTCSKFLPQLTIFKLQALFNSVVIF